MLDGTLSHSPGFISGAMSTLPEAHKMTTLSRSFFSDSSLDYGDDFYRSQLEGSYKSARRYAERILSVYRPSSVVDAGCGRGAWLKAFRDCGAEKIVGLDGPWNSSSNMVDSSIDFRGVDLNKPIALEDSKRFDLAMSVEVAEHLKASSARDFVASLTRLADAVLFASAFSGQGGTNHINEQPHTYWARLFAEQGYLPYDLFRPAFWGDSDIEFWYQQNVFLYVKRNSPLTSTLAEAGHQPLQNIAFMDCIHPALYAAKLGQIKRRFDLKRMVRSAIPAQLLPLARRVRRTLAPSQAKRSG